MVEVDAFGAAEVGQDLHDVILLLGREFVFAVMVTIVRTHAGAKWEQNIPSLGIKLSLLGKSP